MYVKPELVELETFAVTMDEKLNNSRESFEAKVCFSHMLELAADNDVEGFKQYIDLNSDAINEIGLWYGRQLGSRGMLLEYRTPLMVASMYGSLDVMKAILSIPEVDVNRSCGPDKCTALHCAASGGSADVIDAVKLLVANGADLTSIDAKGNRPYDVITVSRLLPQLRVTLEDMLTYSDSTDQKDLHDLGNSLKVTPLFIPTFSESKSLSPSLEPPSSPFSLKSEKKEYPIDPSLPDIKNSIYSTDEFRMYSFKVRPCSRAYSHDWTECPFVHPGENARRRDPRKYHYSCVPCHEFRKGSCRRGDMCEYAHGVFECWLHPAQYRTRLCKDGTSCNRRVCFFAHTPEELRPLYPSTGSAVPSPRSVASAAAVMDMAAALNLFPGSPSAASAMSPSPFTPPLSPSGNGIPHSSAGWQQQNIPTLHLPGSNINNMQTSRLRSSLNARDIPADELSILQDLEMEQRHMVNDMSCFAQSQFNSPSGSLSARPKSMAPSNLDELFSAEISSPRYSDTLAASSVFSPSHKSAVLNHLQQQQQQQQQSMLSPINTKVFSPNPNDHAHLQGSFGPSSPGMMASPRGIEPQSSFNARLSALALRDKQHQMRSLSARDLGANLPRDLIPESGGMPGSPGRLSPWSNWESSFNGRPDWSVNGDELTRLKRSNTVGHNGEEPDLSWVQSLVKDSPSSENKEVQNDALSGSMLCADGSSSNSQVESVDHSTLGAWLDQIAAQ